MKRHLRLQCVTLAILAWPLSGALAQPTAAYERGEAQVWRADRGQRLATAAGRSLPEAAVAALRERGRSDAVLAGLREAGSRSAANGITHLRLEQTAGGLPVHGAYAKAAYNRAGDLVHLIDHLAAHDGAAPAPARTTALQALQAAMAQLHPNVQASFRALGRSAGAERFDGGVFFHQAPSVSAVAVPLEGGRLEQGWLVQTWTQRRNQLHHTLVGSDGRVLDVESRTANDSYNIFTVDPVKTPQSLVAGPGSGNADSPAGWLGAGAQTTVNINGNNVSAYLDVDANNVPDGGGSAVTGGSFSTAASLGSTPTTAGNRAVAVQNLFYLNNVIHDRLRRHGFNEAAGNFQINNFGLGGAGNDPLNAEAQDGSGTDNANMSTPPDGTRPRMQMYLWTGPGPTHEVLLSTGPLYAARGADFGPALTTTGISGTVTLGSPLDGCRRMAGGISGRVALIERGGCDFTTKVLNAQNAGARAVIVYNNTGSTELLTMGGSSTRITIPSVMIGRTDGLALASAGAVSTTLRRKAVQPLQLDAALDSDIVFHEYCHGLTWRMIGGMSGPLAGAIGEGMADGCALLINGDGPLGDVIGEYSAGNTAGIRSAPYGSYPDTYADVTGAGVHKDGEIYAAIVWDMMQRFGPARRDNLFTHIVDGMNFTPATPTYEAMRDGILAAVANSATPADSCLVWRAFGRYGVGVGAKGTVKGTRVTITESFALPAGC